MSAVPSKHPGVAGPFRSGSVRRGAFAQALEAPVIWWAAIGVGFFIFSFSVWGAWLANGAVPTLPPTDLDTTEQLRRTVFLWIERVSILLLIWALYHFTFRPLIRERRLTNDGIAMATMPFLWFQEPIGHWATPWWSYSTYFTNWGNWAGELPGVMSQNVSVIPEPIPFSLACYPVLLGVPMLVILWGMRHYKAAFPNASVPRVLAFGFVLGLIYDFLCEHIPARYGIWSFQRVVSEWSLWAGEYYQYPLYEGVFFGGMAVAMASVLYFTDDKGRTFAERGLERLRVGAVTKGVLRFFAMFGVYSLFFLLIYNMPINLISLHADPMPENMPAHLRAGICGPDTAYVCADNGVPVIVDRQSVRDHAADR